MKSLFLALLFAFSFSAASQNPVYITKKNIPYYENNDSQTDSYIKERCVLDIYYSTNKKGFSTVVWFHGGGLKSGEKHIPNELKEKGICVIAVNYRLYPNVKSPKYIEDAAAAVSWVFKNIASYGGNESLIFLSGHSAGAYLVSMIGLDKKWLGAHNIDADKIAGLIPLSGHTITHMTIREERSISDVQPVVDDFAPLYHVRKDAPPMLLITGDRELEMLGRYEENAYFYRMMKLVGHPQTVLYELDGYGHGMVEPAIPLLLKEIERIRTKPE